MKSERCTCSILQQTLTRLYIADLILFDRQEKADDLLIVHLEYSESWIDITSKKSENAVVAFLKQCGENGTIKNITTFLPQKVMCSKLVCYLLYSWHVPLQWTDDGMFQNVICKKY